MKRIIFSICWIISITVNAQQWEWAQKATATTGFQLAKNVCFDKSGNVFMLGVNQHTAYYGTSFLDSGSFAVKYNPLGNVLWAEKIAGDPIDVCCDYLGNLYVIGNFLGSITIGSFNLSSNGSSDFFIAKFSGSGSVMWAKSFGGNNGDEVAAFAQDKYGNLYVTGYYRNSISFDNYFLNDSLNNGSTNFFLSKINSLGAVQWATSSQHNITATSLQYCGGSYISLDKNQSIYVIGNYTTFPNYSNCSDNFIVKYNSSGILQSDIRPGSRWGHYDGRSWLAIDDSLNIFSTYNSAGHYWFAPVLEKYDSLMNLKWHVNLSDGAYTPNYLLYSGISVDSIGNSYVTGRFGNYNMQSDSVQFCNQWLVRKGGFDILVGKFDVAGNCVFAKTAGGRNDEVSGYLFPPNWNMRVDKKGNCYIVGNYNISGNSNIFNDTVAFDNYTLNNDGNWQQIFVAKLSPSDLMTEVQSLSSKLNDINVFPNPSSGIFTANLENKTVATKICVYDILGNCLLNKDYRKGASPIIDLSGLPKGIYFVNIMSDGGKTMKKIVLQ